MVIGRIETFLHDVYQCSYKKGIVKFNFCLQKFAFNYMLQSCYNLNVYSNFSPTVVLNKIHFITFLEHVVYGHQFMNLAGDNLTNVSLFEEHCENLLCDLISLSLNRYDKVML